MDKAEIVATLKEALGRELLEVARLERCSTPDEFTDMLFTIQDDLAALADRCNVMNQDIITAEAEKGGVATK
jgi:molybdopterin converting factor small subunit